jgi:perosamine synthetase
MEAEIVQKVRSVIGSGKHLLHSPLIGENEAKYVKQVLDSGHLSAGHWAEKFEERLANFVGAKYAVAVMNATCGLHAMITVLPKKEVYRIPSLTFVATANAFSYGNHKIHFVEYDGYADCPVDVLGHPHFQVGGMRDCAQALGSKRNGNYIGSQGTCVFSFNQNKILSGGGGAIITTDDKAIAKEIRHLATTGKIEHAYKTAHDRVAFNYRMSDVTAAILVAQLEQLPLILRAKRALAMQYKKVFGDDFWDEPVGAESNFWLNAVSVPEDELYVHIEALQAAGIQAKPLYDPINRLAPYKDFPCDDLWRTDKKVRETILLPSSPKLGMRFL